MNGKVDIALSTVPHMDIIGSIVQYLPTLTCRMRARADKHAVVLTAHFGGSIHSWLMLMEQHNMHNPLMFA